MNELKESNVKSIVSFIKEDKGEDGFIIYNQDSF